MSYWFIYHIGDIQSQAVEGSCKQLNLNEAIIGGTKKQKI